MGIGAAVAGIDRQEGRTGVQGAAQQRLGLEVVEGLFHPLDLAGDFGGQALVFRGHFDHGGQVAHAADDIFQRLDNRLQALEPADDLLGLLAVIPKIALPHLVFDRGDLRFLPGEVKESP